MLKRWNFLKTGFYEGINNVRSGIWRLVRLNVQPPPSLDVCRPVRDKGRQSHKGFRGAPIGIADIENCTR